jgi:hypothetical protein
MSIEKFSGTFKKEKLGATILLTETLQAIRCPSSLGVYCYLSSKPDDWKINVKELCSHFNKNKDTIRKYLNYLMSINALVKTVSRSSGKFSSFNYELKLSVNTDPCEPLPKKAAPVKPLPKKPAPVKAVTYKAENKQSIESNNNNYNDYRNDELSQYDRDEREQSKQVAIASTDKKQNKKERYLSIVLNNNDYNLPKHLIDDWLVIRENKKSTMTVTAMKGLNRELGICVDQGLNPVDCFQRAVENSWVGLKASWFTDTNDKGGDPLGFNDRGWLKTMLNRKLTD